MAECGYRSHHGQTCAATAFAVCAGCDTEICGDHDAKAPGIVGIDGVKKRPVCVKCYVYEQLESGRIGRLARAAENELVRAEGVEAMYRLEDLIGEVQGMVERLWDADMKARGGVAVGQILAA